MSIPLNHLGEMRAFVYTRLEVAYPFSDEDIKRAIRNLSDEKLQKMISDEDQYFYKKLNIFDQYIRNDEREKFISQSDRERIQEEKLLNTVIKKYFDFAKRELAIRDGKSIDFIFRRQEDEIEAARRDVVELVNQSAMLEKFIQSDLQELRKIISDDEFFQQKVVEFENAIRQKEAALLDKKHYVESIRNRGEIVSSSWNWLIRRITEEIEFQKQMVSSIRKQVDLFGNMHLEQNFKEGVSQFEKKNGTDSDPKKFKVDYSRQEDAIEAARQDVVELVAQSEVLEKIAQFDKRTISNDVTLQQDITKFEEIIQQKKAALVDKKRYVEDIRNRGEVVSGSWNWLIRRITEEIESQKRLIAAIREQTGLSENTHLERDWGEEYRTSSKQMDWCEQYEKIFIPQLKKLLVQVKNCVVEDQKDTWRQKDDEIGTRVEELRMTYDKIIESVKMYDTTISSTEKQTGYSLQDMRDLETKRKNLKDTCQNVIEQIQNDLNTLTAQNIVDESHVPEYDSASGEVVYLEYDRTLNKTIIKHNGEDIPSDSELYRVENMSIEEWFTEDKNWEGLPVQLADEINDDFVLQFRGSAEEYKMVEDAFAKADLDGIVCAIEWIKK